MKTIAPSLHYYSTIAHSPDWYMPAHHHAFHEIIAVETGRMTVLIHGRTLSARAGQVLFYPAGSDHTEWADPKRPAVALCLGYVGGPPGECIDTAIDDRQGRIRQMLRWLHADMSLSKQTRAARLAGLIAAVVGELAYLADAPEPPLLARTRQFIQEHISEPIRLDDLARHAGLSKYHFLRQYRALTGLTPMAAVRRQRIDLARNLLVRTPWPLRVIAQQVGFDNEFHLSRVFRQLTGVSPGSLRKHPRDL